MGLHTSGRIADVVDEQIRIAQDEYNPAAELEELEFHLGLQHKRVSRLLRMARLKRDNDSPDKMTCCSCCGCMMETPPRRAAYVCWKCSQG